jgi:lipopolysaccharide/colanic/teichoic acid biosynthesis glycosyltransferase
VWLFFYEKKKLDEPPIIQYLLGHMSFVGPRPDIAGYTTACMRRATDFKVKPGLTSEASLKYFDEEFYNNGKPKGIQ